MLSKKELISLLKDLNYRYNHCKESEKNDYKITIEKVQKDIDKILLEEQKQKNKK
jgi:hypothetical protein